MATIGTNVLRKEGYEKITGQAKYIADIKMEGMLYGATIRSDIPRGRLINIHFQGDIPWNEFTIVTAKDIPGNNVVASLDTDQPFLVDKFINHYHEAVALIAHPDPYLVSKAVKNIHLETEKLPSIHNLEDSFAKKEIVWGHDNVQKHILIQKGDSKAREQAFQTAAHVVEGVYSTGASEQLYIENNGMISTYDSEEGVTVWGSMQCPYYVHPALCHLFELPEEKVRVIQTETGGGFGGKEDYPSVIAGHAALLAYKSGQPVKLIYDREEDIAATTKRHPSKTWHRTALDENGRILAIEIRFLLDGGAYTTLSPVVLSRGSIHAAGPYHCELTQIESYSLATNTPPHGAYRGFGNPQSLFAMERHMDTIARQLKICPLELRRINFLLDGQTTATGQLIKDGTSMNELLDTVLESIDYETKKKEHAEFNQQGSLRRGVGVSAFFHGSGFTGGGEKKLASIVGVEGTAEGKVRVLAASTEIGQGTKTIFSQICADTLEIPYEMVEIAQPDTHYVPNSGPTVASRTCMIVGHLVERACLALRQRLVQKKLFKVGDPPAKFAQAIQQYLQKHGELQSYSQYLQPAHIRWSDTTYLGDAYATYGWAVYAAEVEVDLNTYQTKVLDFVAMQDVGKVLHPILAEGQIQGGVAQGIGYALSEKVVYSQGQVINNQMTNYIMPTAQDLPLIRVLFEQSPYSAGPQGAKGVGELPIDGPAPTLMSAIEDATGFVVNHIPCLPEDLMKVVQNNDR